MGFRHRAANLEQTLFLRNHGVAASLREAGLRSLPVLLALGLLAGCQPGAPSALRPSGPLAEVQRDRGDTARLTLFLTLRDEDGPGARLEVAGIEVLGEEAWVSVTADPVRLDSAAVGSGQVFLGGRALPPGRYERLRLTVAGASVRRDTGAYEPAVVEPTQVEVELPSPIHLGQEDSASVFLTWDVQGSLPSADRLQPSLTVAPQLRPMLVDLVYAACPEIDTVFVIRTDKNWVADSFGVKGRPTYLAMDPDPFRRRLYVLASGEASIKAVDLSSQRIIDFFRIPLTATPSFLTISPDGRWAYVLDERESYVNLLELHTGRAAARVRLGYRPQHAVYLAGQDLLAVSSGLSQAVFLLHPQSLAEVGRILTGGAPRGLFEAAGQLYIAESGDDTVSVYDLTTNRLLSRIAVGLTPHRLLADSDTVYVSNSGDGSVSVLLPGQLGVIREVYGLGRPLEMVRDPRQRWLYVGDEQQAGLAVIDATANRLAGYIRLGARPLGLAVLQ